MTSFSREIPATLHVHLANGETFEAKPEDVAKFGYVQKLDAYMTFDDHLRKLLLQEGLIEREITEAQLNPVRYIAELAINHPDLLNHPEVRETDAEIVELERSLQEHAKLREEMTRLADGWDRRAADLRGQADRERLDPERVASLTDQAIEWEAAARAVREQFRIGAPA